MADIDEAIIAAVKKASDPDYEPERPERDDDSASITSNDNEDDGYNKRMAAKNDPYSDLDSDMKRLLEDQAIRQQLGIGSHFTGPKGVIEDRKFHMRQEKARAQAKKDAFMEKLSKQALSSGWMKRQLAAQDSEKTLDEELEELEREEEADEDDAFFQEYRAKRLAQLHAEASRPRFGSVLELDESSFVPAIDNEDVNVTIVVHLYQPQIESCRIVNQYFTKLARQYPDVKFARILSNKADESFDLIALPAILVYQAGSLTHTLLRITDEVGSWAVTGRVDFEDFEAFLLKRGLFGQDDD